MCKRFILSLFVIFLCTVVNARYFVINGWNNGAVVDPRTPADIMVDVTNNIGLQVLECHNINNHNNIAFSPYGLTSVLIALQEGVTGEAALQIHRTARFPFDRDVIRVGFRDIHRLLRSYFVPKEGFLAGLSLNNDNITLTPGYKAVLQFFGYDLQTNMTTSTSLPPETTTVMTTVLSQTEKPTSTSPEMPSTSFTTETTEVMTTMLSETPETTTMKISSETTTVAENAMETSESAATTMMSVMSTMSAMTSGETTIMEDTTPIMTSPPTTEAVEIMTTSKSESETTTTEKAEPETTTLPKSDTETTTAQNSEPETTMAEEPKPDTETTTPKSEPETTMAEEPKSETTTVSETPTEPTTITTETSAPEMTPEITTVSTTIPETTSSETVTMTKEDETTMAMAVTPETPAENSEEPPEEPEIENNSPETLESVDTNTDETASASVSSESSNEIETLSIEEMTTMGKSTTSSEELTTNSLETMTMETESPRRKRSLADYLIARHYDGQNYFTFQEPIVTSIPPIQSRQYPFLVNGIKEQYNVNYTEYDTVLPFTYLPLLRSLALKFPLDSDKYYLLIVLPLNPQGVNTLICDIRKYDTLRNIIRNLKDTYVRAIIPSFMLKGFVFLTNTLQRLGIHNIFEPGHADFSLMTEDENIYVTNIEQAVTVTIRNYMESSIKKRHYYNYRPVEFKVTHPFIYFIMDSTLDVTLMTGKVVNPLNSRIQ
ncbi:mucin-3A [Chrysoperla carnea]|uniref:mucin-3A n=1 Tax=Chrysoperla carnea TaxID=189513 RepID=UPI001D0863AB|nr:mucin-3A [Chrysoperla carnea]